MVLFYFGYFDLIQDVEIKFEKISKERFITDDMLMTWYEHESDDKNDDVNL